MMDEDYIKLVKEHLDVTSEACRELLLEMVNEDKDWLKAEADRPKEIRQHEMDVRRAELWKEHLDRAGLTIGRKEPKE